MSNYFPCKIYNTDAKWGTRPTFAILSMTDDYDIESAITQVSNNPPENIFILNNGQQTLNTGFDDFIDNHFGKPLCGIDRIGEDGKWEGDYNIYTSSEYKSVASVLYDDYGNNDLVIDVLNAKFEYGDPKGNPHSFDYFTGQLKTILDAIPDSSSLRFFIAGFSRGGMFSLRLAEWLHKNEYGKETIVVTIDPVISPYEGKDWVEKFAYLKLINWKLKWSIKNIYYPPTLDVRHNFPILKSPGTMHYNVFQRWAGRGPGGSWSALDIPQGFAIKNAIAPPFSSTREHENGQSFKGDKYFEKLPKKSPYNQLDIMCPNHTDMPAKYRDWAIDIAHKHFPRFQLNKTHGYQGTSVIVDFMPIPDNPSSTTVEINDSEINLVWDSNSNNLASFIIPTNIDVGDIEIFFKINDVTIKRNFNVTPQSFELNKTQDYPGAQIEVLFPPDAKKIEATSVKFDGNPVSLTWDNNTAYFNIPVDIEPGIKEVEVKFFNNEIAVENFSVMSPTVKIEPSQANPNAEVQVTFQPAPEETSSISARFGKISVDLSWDESHKNKASFAVPETAKAGDEQVLTSFFNRTFVSHFMVTPYVKSCQSKYVQRGSIVQVNGSFHQDDVVVIDKLQIIPQFTNNGLTFIIPDEVSTGEKEVFVLSDSRHKSNRFRIIICKSFDLLAAYEPNRISYSSEKVSTKFVGLELMTDDIVLFNEQEVEAKIKAKNGNTTVEFDIPSSQSLTVVSAIRIVRKENEYYMSNPFAMLVCDRVGNTNSMELHHPECTYVKSIKSTNRVLINSEIDKPWKNGYDNCHWCLGGSKR